MNCRAFFASITLAIALTIPTFATNTTGISNVDYRTSDEILTLYHMMKLDETVPTSFVTEPDIPNHTTSGVISPETEQNAINTLNFVRYIAGLPYDVAIDKSYATYAQDTAFALAVEGEGITHYIDRSSWMTTTLYASASHGAKSSNISAGRSNLSPNIIHGWMADEAVSNRSILGHRRWILNPTMAFTGFGIAQNPSSQYKYYSAMYAHDNPFDYTDVSGVVWPAQTMPVEYFGGSYPWSYSLGSHIGSDVCVTLTRESDGKQWVMEMSSNGTSGDGFIATNDDYYGRSGCISFVPDNISYSAGDVFHVEITGTRVNARYTVTFMSLSDSYTAQPSVGYSGTVPEVSPVADADPWAQPELQSALNEGYPVTIYSHKFTEAMTRGEFAHMLGLFLGMRWEITGNDYSSEFTDLGTDPANAQRNEYIIALNQWGIIDGTSETTFSPDATITREAAATLLKRAVDLRLTDTVTQDISSFSDAGNVAPWALDGVRYMNQLGVLKGTDDNRINPQGNIKVEEAAIMCYRLKP